MNFLIGVLLYCAVNGKEISATHAKVIYVFPTYPKTYAVEFQGGNRSRWIVEEFQCFPVETMRKK